MAISSKLRQYTHQELWADNTSLSGYYSPFKEVKQNYQGRTVLYIVGHAAINNSCCGISNWEYVLVPGYLVDWHVSHDQKGLPVSTVEPINDSGVRQDLTRIIAGAENTDRISFW